MFRVDKFTFLATLMVVSIPAQIALSLPSKDSYLSLFDRSRRIVGGSPTHNGEFPFLVSLQLGIHGKYHHVCAGALINLEWVITVAQCMMAHEGGPFPGPLLTDDPQMWKVRVGDHHLNMKEGTEDLFQVIEIVKHPEFDIHQVNKDIALVRLGGSVRVTRFVKPVRMAEFTIGTTCVMVGWGYTNRDGDGYDDVSPTPKKVLMPVTQNDVCNRAYAVLGVKLTSSQICAGDIRGGKGSCMYDAGDPLVCPGPDGRMRLFGINSVGHPNCAEPGFPDVFTKVSDPDIISWIRETIHLEAKTK